MKQQQKFDNSLRALAGMHLSKYMESHSIDADHESVYLYLAEEHIRHKSGSKTPIFADISDKEMTSLFDGLTGYFEHAGDFQEKLIAVNVAAAFPTLVTEALIVSLDQNQDIQTKDQLRSKVTQVLNTVLSGTDNAISELPEELASQLENIGKHSQPDLQKQALEYLRSNTESVQKIADIMRLNVNDMLQVLGDPAQEDTAIELLSAYADSLNLNLMQCLTDEALTIIRNTSAENLETRVEAQAALRKWASEVADTRRYAIAANRKEDIRTFRATRDKQTQKINDYQKSVMEMTRRTERALTHLLDGKNAEETADYNRLFDLLAALEDRTEEIEQFRNGLIKQLPPQPPILSECPIEDATVRKIFDGISNTRTEGTVGIPDRDKAIANLQKPVHPLIEDLEIVRNGLRTLVIQAPNQNYLKDIPSVMIFDNGVKSWKRTIDKLVREKNSDWEEMNDLARLNITFNRAETMYQYNQTLRRVSGDIGWHSASPKDKESPYRDRGIVLPPTGSMLWLMNLFVGRKNNRNWGVEVKFDCQSQSKLEYIHHKIFECARLLETEDRSLDFEALQRNPETYANFIQQTLKITDLLLSDKSQHDLSDVIFDELTTINTLARKALHASPEETLQNAEKLYGLLTDTHIAICCYAARSQHRNRPAASPSMSALYAVHFEAMLEKKEKEIADRYPNVVLSPERDAELKKVEHTRSIFQKHGPLQGVDFGKYHRATAERLVEEHLQSFKPLNQEQQLTA